MAPRVGIVGDYNPQNPTHRATDAGLAHAGVRAEWVPTADVPPDGPGTRLAGYDGLFIAPASPYRSMDGALAAIRLAREGGIPLVGTCGGFQHAIVEFARNVLGIEDADHAETAPGAPRLAIAPLACSLVGQSHPVTLVAGTRAAALYGATEAVEDFRCSYGLNPDYAQPLRDAGLVASGYGHDGAVRVVELPRHPFFLATLFLPQMRSTPDRPHPLLAGFAKAAASARGS